MILNTIKSVLTDNWPILTIFLVTMITMRYFYLTTHHEKISFYKEFLSILGIIYIFLLFQLLTKVELNQGGGYNLVPFTEILRYEFGSKLFIYNVVGNICMFIPFGFMVAEYVKPKTIVPPLVIALIVSTTTEFVQLNIGRSFDVDDILLNIIGCIAGYLLYIALTAIRNHLPKFFQKDGFYNTICLILIIVMIVYILKMMGVLAL